MQRSFAPVAAIKADPMTAHPGHEQVLTTLSRHRHGRLDLPETDDRAVNEPRQVRVGGLIQGADNSLMGVSRTQRSGCRLTVRLPPVQALKRLA